MVQGPAVVDSVATRTRNGGSCSYRPNPAEQKRKCNKHITMKFLEEGGYFDAPIQVQTPAIGTAVKQTSSCGS